MIWDSATSRDESASTPIYNATAGSVNNKSTSEPSKAETDSNGKVKDGNNKPTKNERAQAKKNKSSTDSDYGVVNPHTTQSNGNRRQKHEKGEATNQRNQGGEKADKNRQRTQDSKKRK